MSQSSNTEDTATGFANLFSYSNLVHAVSGATGSVVAISVFYPLDTVRTRLQVDDHRRAKNTFMVMKEIIQEEGIESLYLGWFPVVTALCCSNFVYFYTYHGLKSAVLRGRRKATPLVDLSLAFVSGVVNVLITTPMWVANTRLKLQGAKLHTVHYNKKDDDLKKDDSQNYSGIIDCILKIAQKEGIKKLWGGTVASILLASNPAIQFMVYEALKRYFIIFFKTSELSGLVYFLLGAIAKTVSTIITYPLQVIQSRLRAGYAKAESSLTLMENILHLIKARGFGALYKGMEAKLLQTVLTSALMFLIYEKISALIFKIMGLR